MTFSIVDEDETETLDKGQPGEIDWQDEAEQRLDLTQSELEQAMDDCIEAYDGLVGRDAAAIIVARSHDVNLVEELRDDPSRIDLEIENVVPSMSSVDIRLKVETVQSVNEFDGGRVRSAIVSDSTGETQLTFWDEDVEALDSIERGDEVVVRNGYTNKSIRDYQKDRYGVPAIQVGDETAVEVSTEEGYVKVVEPDG